MEIKEFYDKLDQKYMSGNPGGPAPCQSDKDTFVIMRRCQFKAWNEETQESCLEDLKAALKNDWNSQHRLTVINLWKK